MMLAWSNLPPVIHVHSIEINFVLQHLQNEAHAQIDMMWKRSATWAHALLFSYWPTVCVFAQEIKALKDAAELAQEELLDARSLAESLKQQVKTGIIL